MPQRESSTCHWIDARLICQYHFIYQSIASLFLQLRRRFRSDCHHSMNPLPIHPANGPPLIGSFQVTAPLILLMPPISLIEYQWDGGDAPPLHSVESNRCDFLMSYSIRQINVFICPALTISLEAEVNPSSSASGGKFPSFIFHQQ